MNFGKLIIGKIIKIAVTRCRISNAKMRQIWFQLGLRPKPHLGSSPNLLAGFKGPTSKGKGGDEKGIEERGGNLAAAGTLAVRHPVPASLQGTALYWRWLLVDCLSNVLLCQYFLVLHLQIKCVLTF